VTSAANSLLPHHREHLINLFTSAEKLAADHKAKADVPPDFTKIEQGKDGYDK
jgi:hypothetical protein